MTHIIIAINNGTFIYQTSEKSPEEVSREIELGVFPFIHPMRNPAAVRLRDYILVMEREAAPMLSRKQLNVLEMLSLGASETEIGRAMGLSYSGVRHHIEALKKKFSVSTREELIAQYSRLPLR